MKVENQKLNYASQRTRDESAKNKKFDMYSPVQKKIIDQFERTQIKGTQAYTSVKQSGLVTSNRHHEQTSSLPKIQNFLNSGEGKQSNQAIPVAFP